MITMNVSGNIAADAIVRNVNGIEVVNFSVCSNNRYNTKSGEIKEDVTFMYCELWNKTDVAKLFFKGRPVSVAGFFKVRNFVGTDGVLKTFFSLRITSFQVHGKGKVANDTNKQDNQIFTNDYPETEKPPMEDIIDDLPF